MALRVIKNDAGLFLNNSVGEKLLPHCKLFQVFNAAGLNCINILFYSAFGQNNSLKADPNIIADYNIALVILCTRNVFDIKSPLLKKIGNG